MGNEVNNVNSGTAQGTQTQQSNSNADKLKQMLAEKIKLDTELMNAINKKSDLAVQEAIEDARTLDLEGQLDSVQAEIAKLKGLLKPDVKPSTQNYYGFN